MRSHSFAFLSLVVVAGLTAILVAARPSEPASNLTAPPWYQDQDAMDAMMKGMLEAATPGEIHAKIARSVGEWDVAGELFMGPEATKSTATCSITSVLGGRFIRLVEKGEVPMTMNGEKKSLPCESIVYIGYDNTTKEYVSVNMSTFGTGIYTMAGNEKDGTIQYAGLMCDFMSPKKPGRPCRAVLTEKDENHFTFEMYDTVPAEMANEQMKAGAEFLVMRATYTRKGAK